MVGWCIETTLVASGLAIVAALASRFRSIGPTARHLLWLVVLLKLVTPPLLSWPWAVDWGHQSRLITMAATTYSAPVVAADDSIEPSSSRVADTTATPEFDEPGALGPFLTDFDTVPVATELVRIDSTEANSAVLARLRRALSAAAQPGQIGRIVAGLGRGWLLLSALLGLAQAWRIIRFRDRLQSAVPAPDDLIDEAERIAGCLGVRVPELLVVSDLHTPLVWCLGRPKLLLPAHLVKTLGLDQWRAILIHELAHIRRGDHWVSRLELVAGLIWWWNPIYWLARNRLDAEAELACDAWVVSVLPKDRLAYAEALFDIFSTLSMAGAPAPALGATGSGRLFRKGD